MGGGGWGRGEAGGGPLILETRAQKADGQIRAVSPHDRSPCGRPARLERTGDRPEKDRKTLSSLRREAATEQAGHRDSDAPEPLVRGPGVLHTRQPRRLSLQTLRSLALRAREHKGPQGKTEEAEAPGPRP